jgi:hypothetical protein
MEEFFTFYHLFRVSDFLLIIELVSALLVMKGEALGAESS